jgi:hypothetical protein
MNGFFMMTNKPNQILRNCKPNSNCASTFFIFCFQFPNLKLVSKRQQQGISISTLVCRWQRSLYLTTIKVFVVINIFSKGCILIQQSYCCMQLSSASDLGIKNMHWLPFIHSIVLKSISIFWASLGSSWMILTSSVRWWWECR